MDRLARRVAWRTVAFAFLVPIAARAQTLAVLHVRDFSLSADRTRVRVGETFHLTITARLRDTVDGLDNVTLPDLAGFDVVGDERRCNGVAGPAPYSTCIEVVTLQPNVADNRTIGPATLDAVDARDGRPKRYSTNTITVIVDSPLPSVPTSGIGGPIFGLMKDVAILSIVVFTLLVSIALGTWALAPGRRRARVVAPAPISPAPPIVVDPNARYREVIAAFRAEPSRARALDVRAELRSRLRARDDETMRDIAERCGDARDVRALRAIERVVFCSDPDLPATARESQSYLLV